MPKILDQLLEFPPLAGPGPALAHLRVYRHAARTIAIVGELTDNQSTSVTNAMEEILSILRDRYDRNVAVVEHYPADGTTYRPEPTWDVVTGSLPKQPLSWRRLPSTRDLESLVGEPVQAWPADQYTAAMLRARTGA